MSKEEMRDRFEARWGQTNDEQGLYFIPELNTYGCELAKNQGMADRKSSAWYYFQLGQESALVATPKADAQPVAYISASVLAHLMAGGDAGWQWIGPVAYGSDQVGLFTRSDAGEVDLLKEGIAKHWKVVCDQRAELETLRAQLADAAQSLETISRLAGRDEFMEDMADVRGYANSRASVARGALSVIAEPVDLESRPEERGCPELEPCSGCGTPGWTGRCDQCIPY